MTTDQSASSAGALETRFDAAFTARLALREKQVQQSYRPIIGLHKWFARRPGSLFRSLLVSEFADGPVSEEYWRDQRLTGTIADPFMGGGTSVFEALRLGFNVVGSDVNPMAYWLVRQGVEPMNIAAFEAAGEAVWKQASVQVGRLYETQCVDCESTADVKYFLWVKTCICPSCSKTTTLFPGLRLAEAVRHPRTVYHCPACECLREFEPDATPTCPECESVLSQGNVRRGQAECWHCHHQFAFAPFLSAPPEHQLVGIEYRCPSCYDTKPGRQFKTPDEEDLERVEESTRMLSEMLPRLSIPDDAIPAGDETDRLLRWGYRSYREMFNNRQLLSLGVLLAEIETVSDTRIRQALATVFSDFLRYQNLLCRYDTYALKCQDIFAVHGFPVALLACENNSLGIPKVGSGSFIHFVSKFTKAKDYAQRPFETRRDGSKKHIVRMSQERIESTLRSFEPTEAEPGAWLTCEPSQTLDLRPQSLDGVFTDPPYFDNVQYAELMDFCFVWLRKLLHREVPAFTRLSTRTDHELTGNSTMSRGLEDFTQGISDVFCSMSRAMKPGAPLVFTYHHNDASAYLPLIVAILDAELRCTAVLPAPAEMAASLHIAGTKSSILDSVFVCRKSEYVALTQDDVDGLVRRDRAAMAEAGYSCTEGDLLCLRAGHVAAATIGALSAGWDPTLPVNVRIAEAKHAIERLLDRA